MSDEQYRVMPASDAELYQIFAQRDLSARARAFHDLFINTDAFQACPYARSSDEEADYCPLAEANRA
jgi:TorA maturation chaperone TorD